MNHVRALLLAFNCWTACALGEDAVLLPQHVSAALKSYCAHCHDQDTKEAGFDVTAFKTELAALNSRVELRKAYDLLEGKQMPPPKRKAQPSDEERTKLMAWIADLMARPDPRLGSRDPGKPVLRRMNRLEYNNTVRDLFGLTNDVFMFPERLPFAKKDYFKPDSGQMGDRVETAMREYGAKYPVLLPQCGLPGDNRAEHGFSNRGDALSISPLLFEKYVALAGEIFQSDKMLDSPVLSALISDPATSPAKTAAPKSNPQKKTDSRIGTAEAVGVFAPNGNIQAVVDGSNSDVQHWRATLAETFDEHRGGVFDAPTAGVLERGSPLNVSFGEQRSLEIVCDQSLWMVGFATAKCVSGGNLIANQSKGSKSYTLRFKLKPDAELSELGLVVLSRNNASGPVSLAATFSGGSESKLSHEFIAGSNASNSLFVFHAPTGESIVSLRVDGSKFSGDYVLIDDIGFVVSSGGPTERRPAIDPVKAPEPKVVHSETPKTLSPAEKRESARQRLTSFLPKAFRRTVRSGEADRYLKIYDVAVAGGASFESAMMQTLQAILSSPGFLFRAESIHGDTSVRPLDDFEIANRLSYFLWASMPDDALLESARKGELRDPAKREAQVRRMLKNRKISELSESFATQWLRLDQVYSAKPDPKLFKAFYAGPQGKDTLHSAVLTEGLLLCETILVEDRPIFDLVDADYTWLNKRMMKLYGLEDQFAPMLAPLDTPADAAAITTREVKKDNKDLGRFWFRCKLTDHNRGGVLGMSAVLMSTSLPFRTSPVKRGAWLLETLFNRPPSEPQVAFALKDDKKEVQHAESVRQRFEQHRNDAACYSCHVRIDPPGFALERFDPIGVWREKDGAAMVDATGEWNGQKFDGPAEFKRAVMAKRDEFARGFIEHLLSYALGRKLEWYDMPAVREIMQSAAADGYRFSSVVIAVTNSYPFLNVRNINEPDVPLEQKP